jgi:ribose/xylose/arabinose/galactoside ABC-type transport system permease subunit
MFWQAFYAVVGCVIGAAVLGNYGALIGTLIGKIIFFLISN